VTVRTGELTLQTRGNGDMLDITAEVQRVVSGSSVEAGVVVVSVIGSTAGDTTNEYKPGLVEDFSRSMEKVAPIGDRYAHDSRWGDGNGHSHVRASLLGPSLTLPVLQARAVVGTWQQIVLVDFDTRDLHRRVVVQLVGE